MKKMVENNFAGLHLPKVFVVIVNSNGKEFLLKTLTELFCLNYSNFEVVLVDNNSKDGSLEELRRSFSKVTIIKNSSNIGIYAGMNIGIKYVLERGAKYILLLRHNAVGFKQSLPALVAEMEKNQEIGLSSPVVSENDNNNIFLGGKVNWLKMKLVPSVTSKKENYLDSDYLVSGAVLVRAEVFRKAGLLNEKYPTFYGEADLSFKAKKQGYKLLICQNLPAVCLEESQSTNSDEKYLLILSTLAFFKSNTPVYLIPWVTAFFIFSFLKNWIELKFFKQANAINIQRAYLDFYRNEGIF